MQIDFNIIGNKYPNSFDKFYEYAEKELPGYYEHNAICYCDIEKFFDDNGIIITIDRMMKSENWFYRIKLTQDLEFCIHSSYDNLGKWNSRQEAKLEAIYKAFEIMEHKNDK